MIPIYDSKGVRDRIYEVMPEIIEEFVRLYGEKFRDIITQRIAATPIYVYNEPNNVIESIRKEIKDLENKLRDEPNSDEIITKKKEELRPLFNSAREEVNQMKEIQAKVERSFLERISQEFPNSIKNKEDMKLPGSKEARAYSLGLESAGYIDAFSLENFDELISEETPEILKEVIIHMQISYLISKGIDINRDNYEEVIGTEECRRVIPNFEEVILVERFRKSFLAVYYKELVENIPSYKEVYELGGVNDIKEIISILRNGGFNNNMRYSDGNLRNVINLSIHNQVDCVDVGIVHELVHAIEIGRGPDGVTRCAFDDLEGNNTSLNEVKTDMIARIVTERLHQRGVFLIDEPNKSKIHVSMYEKNDVVVSEFISEFMDEILEFGMTLDMDKFLNKVGKRNFEKFTQIVFEYDSISRFKINTKNLVKDPNNPIFRKHNNLVRASKEVVSKMKLEAFGTPGGVDR